MYSGRENLTLKQILDKMSAITGIPSPTVKIPFAVAATYASLRMDHGTDSRKEPRRRWRGGGAQEDVCSSAHAQQNSTSGLCGVSGDAGAIEWFGQTVCAVSRSILQRWLEN